LLTPWQELHERKIKDTAHTIAKIAVKKVPPEEQEG
jgi:hypothetical protein